MIGGEAGKGREGESERRGPRQENRGGGRERKIPGQGVEVSEPGTQRKSRRQPGVENTPEDVEINR